jgi:hypothetical protein
MTGPETTADEDVLTGIRVARGILSGETGPWTVPSSTIQGLALMLNSALGALAAREGITDTDLQVLWIRGWLDDMEQAVTITLHERDIRRDENAEDNG